MGSARGEGRRSGGARSPAPVTGSVSDAEGIGRRRIRLWEIRGVRGRRRCPRSPGGRGVARKRFGARGYPPTGRRSSAADDPRGPRRDPPERPDRGPAGDVRPRTSIRARARPRKRGPGPTGIGRIGPLRRSAGEIDIRGPAGEAARAEFRARRPRRAVGPLQGPWRRSGPRLGSTGAGPSRRPKRALQGPPGRHRGVERPPLPWDHVPRAAPSGGRAPQLPPIRAWPNPHTSCTSSRPSAPPGSR